MKESYYIKKIRNGDQSALNSFIEELYPQVYTFVFYKVQGKDDAKDITQEVFLRFVRQIATYKSQDKILNYLFRIASNVCIDFFHHTKRHEYLELNEEIAMDIKEDIHIDVLKKLRNEELILFIKQLTPQQQDVIILKYFEQYTFKEIAMMYQIAESTIKSRHTQALIKLRRKMKGDKRDGTN